MIVGLGFLGCSTSLFAKQCSTSVGTYPYTFNFNIGSSQNYVGYTTGWQEQKASGSYKIAGECNTSDTTYYSATSTSRMSFASSDSDGTTWYNVDNNDYLQVATQISIWNRNNGAAYHNVPFRDVSNSCNGLCPNSPAGSGSQVKIKLRIKRKFVGESYIVSQPIAHLYGNQGGTGQALGSPIVSLFLNAKFTVPQSCDFEPNQVVEFDFGSISAQSFAKAGANNKPDGVNVQAKNINVKCKNLDAQLLLTMRVEANNVKGNAIVSDNADVGFIIADTNNRELTPNNISSNIPFKLDDNAAAVVPIKAWPVSTTGNKPTAGKAEANGYLRIDFQ